MAHAHIADVAARLGRPITDPDEVNQVNAWLADVDALITSRIADYEALVGAGTPSVAVAVMVEANAVVRKIRNPEGKVSEDIDDYRYRLNADAARGDVFLTSEEWALLSPGSGGEAFTIRPYSTSWVEGTWVHPDTWVPSP